MKKVVSSKKILDRAIRLFRAGSYERSLRLASRHLGNSPTGQHFRCLVAMNMLHQGEHEAARSISESLIGDSNTMPHDRFRAYYILAMAAKHFGEYPPALNYLDRARDVDDSAKYEATYFYESGGVYLLQGRFAEARVAIRTAIRINSKKNDQVALRSRQKYQCALAFVLGLQGNPERGLRILGGVEFPSNERFSIAIKELYTGSLLGLAGDPWTALQHHEEAAAIINDLRELSAGAMAYNLLAEASFDCGETSEARRCVQVGYRLAMKTGDVFETARSKLILSALCEKENESERGRAYREEAAQVLHRIGSEWVFDRHLAKIEAR
jgi:tetratricopeptide (TPR) repeat protein